MFPTVYTHSIYVIYTVGDIPWGTFIYCGCILWRTCLMFPTVYDILWGTCIYCGEHVPHSISRYIPWVYVYAVGNTYMSWVTMSILCGEQDTLWSTYIYRGGRCLYTVGTGLGLPYTGRCREDILWVPGWIYTVGVVHIYCGYLDRYTVGVVYIYCVCRTEIYHCGCH